MIFFRCEFLYVFSVLHYQKILALDREKKETRQAKKKKEHMKGRGKKVNIKLNSHVENNPQKKVHEAALRRQRREE